MKMKISYFDKKKVFCKADKKQGTVILFQRPPGAKESDQDCESYYQDICSILASRGGLFASDLVGLTEWSDDDKALVGDTLCVLFDGNNDNIKGSSIRIIPRKSFDEIYLKEKVVAKIKVKRNNSLMRFVILALSLAACVAVGFLIMDFLDKNRMAENQVAYNEDIARIEELKKTINDACSLNNSFSKNISDNNRKEIVGSLNLLQQAADNNFQSVRDRGKYRHVDIEKTGIEPLINNIIENAKLKYSKEEERGRIYNNDSLHEHDIQAIEYWQKKLNKIVSQHYYGKTNLRINHVQYMLDSLKSVSDSSFLRVAESGIYVPVQFDSVKIESRIHRLIPRPAMPHHRVRRPR